MTFAGFHSDAFTFYDELADHNPREWWLANKKRYDEHVRGPVAALVEQLGTEFGAIKIFRPNRDVRFSSDKSPYKTQISFVTQTATGAAHYLQLGSDGVMIAGATTSRRAISWVGFARSTASAMHGARSRAGTTGSPRTSDRA